MSAALPIDAYLSMLRVGGVMANVGAPPENLSYNAFALLGGNKVLAGSLIGGIAETQQMLDFCAEHGVRAEIEVIAADRINGAYERVENSDVRYRFVIDIYFHARDHRDRVIVDDTRSSRRRPGRATGRERPL